MANPITAEDWASLQALGDRVGLPPERVGRLKRRFDEARKRPGAPYVLLAGRPDSGCELMLARRFSPDLAEAIKALPPGRAAVLGLSPREVIPRLVPWSAHEVGLPGPMHVVVLLTSSPPAADVVTQLEALGSFDEVLLVVRAAQAMHIDERALLQSFAPLAATARVLLVGLQGEEASDADLAQISDYTRSHIEDAGFDGERCLGVTAWIAGEEHSRPGTTLEPETLLIPDPSRVEAGRPGMARAAVAELLREIRDAAETASKNGVPGVLPTPEGERERLVRELAGFLADLERDLERTIAARPTTTQDAIRREVLDTLRGWGAYTGIEGHWMKYVDRIRAGAQTALIAEAEQALSLLEYTPPPPASDAKPATAAPSLVTVEVKRLALALACGVVAYAVTNALLTNSKGIGLPSIVVALISYAALGFGGVLGYGAGPLVFGHRPAVKDEAEAGQPPGHGLVGWKSFERRLIAWFAEYLNPRPDDPMGDCLALARRLGLPFEETAR